MYCGKCGAQIQNNAAFCPNCGNRLAPIKNVVKKRKNKALIISLVVVLVTACIITAFVLFTNKGYEKPIKNFFIAMEQNDCELLEKSQSEYLNENLSKDYLYAGYSGNIYKNIIDEYEENLNCGNDIEIDYQITEVIDAQQNDYSLLKSNYSFWYEYITDDDDEYDVKNPMFVKVSVNVKGNEATDSFTDEFLIIKENGKWKILKLNILTQK